jgi:hypothetical protein
MPDLNKRLASVFSKPWPEWYSPALQVLWRDPWGGWRTGSKYKHEHCYSDDAIERTEYEVHAICEKWLRERLVEKKAYILLHADGWWFVERHLRGPDYKCEILTCEGWRRWLPARLPSRFKTYLDAAVAAVEACQKESKP